jgi:hypothetical protein
MHGFGKARLDFGMFEQEHNKAGEGFSIRVRTPQFVIENELEISIWQYAMFLIPTSKLKMFIVMFL